MDLTTIARNVFANDLYATKATGISIDRVEEGIAVCSLKLAEIHRNAKGHIMGGVIFTLADFAFAIAANSGILANVGDGEQPQLLWVSASSTIHYLSAAKGDSLKATASAVRQGRTQAVFQILVTDSENRKVALVTTSGTKIEKPTL